MIPNGHVPRARDFGLRLLAAGALLAACACGSETSPTTPTPPPPVVNNTPPVIDTVSASLPRIEAGATLSVAATLHDAETALDQLTYAWTGTPVNGTFTGSGPNQTWQAPTGQRTPDLYTLKFSVTENYTSAGQPQRNEVSATTTVHYNDTRAEIAALSNQFFEWFTTYSVSPATAVSQFSDNCSGKADELGDVTDNRSEVVIHGGDWNHSPDIAYVGTGTPWCRDAVTASGPVPTGPQCAVAFLACAFYDTPKTGETAGQRRTATGTCELDALYEDWHWSLCASWFHPGNTVASSVSRPSGLRYYRRP